jgi:hypothetical protein
MQKPVNWRPKKTVQLINERKTWFLGKLNKIDKLLAKLTKRRKENTQINKIRGEKGNITMGTNEILMII